MIDHRPPLQIIGQTHNCDKFTVHNFAPQYERHLGHLRDAEFSLLEIGIGGEGEVLGGESIKTWADYFSQAKIHGIDLYDKSALQTSRITTHVLNQADQDGLRALWEAHGGFDVVIDDGSHKCADTLRSFFALFNLMRPGGVYVIEDLQTSYWPHYGGTSVAQPFADDTIFWVKTLIDCLNANEILWKGHAAIRSGFVVSELHLYRNIAFIVRGQRIEPSNVLTEEIRQAWLADDARQQGLSLVEAEKINDPNWRRAVLRRRLDGIGD